MFDGISLKFALNAALNTLFTPKCAFCEQPLALDSTVYICEQCYTETFVADCGDREYQFEPSFDGLVYRYRYQGNVRDAIYKMKFSQGKTWMCETLGFLLGETVKEYYFETEFDAVVYIPISGQRMCERLFNQSEIIAERVSASTGIPLLRDVLSKNKNVLRQSSLDMQQRFENVIGAFKVKKAKAVQALSLLLVDDVIATGATINECCKMLIEAGAKSVHCAVVSGSTAR